MREIGHRVARVAELLAAAGTGRLRRGEGGEQANSVLGRNGKASGLGILEQMSERDLELVRALNRAFNERQADWVRFYADDAEVRVPPGWLEDRVFRGHRDIERVAGLWTQNVSEYRWDLERLIDAGDCVVGLFRFSSRIDRRGQWLAPPLGAVFYFREGKVTRVLTFFSWQEALEVAGVDAGA